MKLTKFASTTMLAAFALGTLSAEAAIGTVTNYSKLNISMIITTNGAYVLKGDTYKYPVGSAKVTNKTLLALFASSSWGDTTFPAGAQLVVGWDSGTWDGDVLVVDKTGTNVLLDVDSLNSGNQEFYIETDYEDGAYTETYVDASPGYESWKETYMSYFYLYDNDNSIDLWGYPTSQQTFKQSWDKNDNYSGWSDSESINLGGGMGGDQELNGNSSGSVSGKITMSGKGSTLNDFWY